jgi:hypothetical protein
MTDDTFSRRMREVQAEIDRIEMESPVKSCVPTAIIIGIVIPILLFGIFYIFTPDMMKCQKDGTRQRSVKKVFWWSLIFSLAAWLALFALAWKFPSVLCIKF